MRPYSLIAGIFNLVVGALFCATGGVSNTFTLIVGSFYIVTGVIFIMYSKYGLERLSSKKSNLLTWGIVFIPINFITAIFLLLEYDSIKKDCIRLGINVESEMLNNGKEKAEISKEARKVDGLIKIGVAMVAVAGVMIVTTSWESITNIIKLGILLIIAIVFIGLSLFSDMKLKIKNTTVAYWLLSMIAFGLAAFLVGYGEMFGKWFSFNGSGSEVFMAAFLAIVALLTFLTYKKFSINAFLYATYCSIIAAVAFMVDFLGQKPEVCVLVIALVLAIINTIPKSEKKDVTIIKNFALAATFFITPIIIGELSNITNSFIIGINLIVQIISLVVLAINEKNDVVNILSSIAIIVLTVVSANNLMDGVYITYKVIITRSIFIVMACLISLLIIRDKKVSNMLLSIALPLVVASAISHVYVEIGVFIGIVALAMIIAGLAVKEFRTLYYEGIIITILNLVIQLWEFWGEIPVSVYLLVGGFLLIGIVTVKELRKKDKSSENLDTNIEEKVEVIESNKEDEQ